MDPIGINTNVFAGGKMYHIQTAGNYGHLSIKSEIWEQGRVIYVERTKVDPERAHKMTPEQFNDYMNAFHQEVSWEIELLYIMRDKVHSIKHPVSTNKMGMVFLRRGMLDEAIGEFLLAAEYQPDMIEAYSNLGTAYIQKKDYAAAGSALTRALELAPNYPDIHHALGMAYHLNKQYVEALESFHMALKINPNYAEALFSAAAAFIDSCIFLPDHDTLPPPSIRKKRAAEYLEKVKTLRTDIGQDNTLAAMFQQFIDNINADQLAQAVKNANEIREYQKKDTYDELMNSFYLKFLFGGAGKDEKILEKYQKKLETITEINPVFADVQNTLGLVYLVQCRNLFIKAMNQFKKASEINPSYKAAYKNYRLVQNDGKEFLNLLRAILK